MALITCEECGQTISSTAESCPHCGHKTNYAKVNAKRKDTTIAVYICIAAVCVGLFLLIPALVTLMDNYNDWYFWNWYTDRSDEVVRNIGLGIGLTGGGLGVLLGLRKKAKKEQDEEKGETDS